MKVKDLVFDQIVVGLTVKSLDRNVLGTITEITSNGAEGNWDAWITWDGDSMCYSGFEFCSVGKCNSVENEVLCNVEGKPIVVKV